MLTKVLFEEIHALYAAVKRRSTTEWPYLNKTLLLKPCLYLSVLKDNLNRVL